MNRRGIQRTPRKPKNEPLPGLRFRHCFSMDVNVTRLQRHVNKMVAKFTRDGELANIRRKRRLRERTQKAKEKCPVPSTATRYGAG